MPPCDGNNAVDIEIGTNRLTRPADSVSFIRLETVQGKTILVRVDGHRADAELVSAAKNARGDLAAIGDHQLADRAMRRCWRIVPHEVSLDIRATLISLR